MSGSIGLVSHVVVTDTARLVGRHAVRLLGLAVAAAVVVEGRVAAVGDELLLVAAGAAVRAGAALGLAAADGEDPEHTGGERKGGAQPGDGEEGRVDVAFNSIPLGRGLDGADDHNRHGSHQCGVGADGERRDTRDDPGQAAHGARARCEEGEEELDTQSDHGDDVDDLGPLGYRLESVKRADELLGKLDLDAGSSSDRRQRGRVQVRLSPVKLGLGAVALVILAGPAVAPEVDVVQVGEAEVGGGDVVAQEGGRVNAGRRGLVLGELVDGGVHITAALLGFV